MKNINGWVKCKRVLFLSALVCALSACSNDHEGTTTKLAGDADGLGGTVSEAVDLGLSVKWATHNVGAKSAVDYGGLYGWADAMGRNTSTDDNEYPDSIPLQEISGTQYDIVRIHWGGKWRLPTQKEFQELLDSTTYVWTFEDGVAGYRFTSRKNSGAFLFLPAAGYRSDTTISNGGDDGYYWSGTLSSSGNAYLLRFDKTGAHAYRSYRNYGRSVRPVTD